MENKFFNIKDYKLFFIILVQAIGAILGLVKLLKVGELILYLAPINLLFAILFFTLCMLGLTGCVLLYKKKKLGFLFTRINYYLQIPLIQLGGFLYEYFLLAQLKLFWGGQGFGFIFNTGTTFRIGIDNFIEYGTIGLNIFPFIIIYLLYSVENSTNVSNQ